MNPRDLVRLAHDLQGQSLAQVNTELQRRALDAETRLQVKLEMRAQAQMTHARGDRLTARGETAHDRAEWHPGAPDPRPLSTMDRLLRRAGLHDDRHYTTAEIDDAARGADITDPTQRLALKIECASRGMIGIGLDPHASEADRLLRNLGIDGPVDHERLELKLDQLGYGPSTKSVILSECQMRGWLRGGGNLRTMKASAARGTVLRDRQGNHLTLRSYPE